ncbi:hypothetical protein GN956_G3637 [Arapaima gigas]
MIKGTPPTEKLTGGWFVLAYTSGVLHRFPFGEGRPGPPKDRPPGQTQLICATRRQTAADHFLSELLTLSFPWPHSLACSL